MRARQGARLRAQARHGSSFRGAAHSPDTASRPRDGRHLEWAVQQQRLAALAKHLAAVGVRPCWPVVPPRAFRVGGCRRRCTEAKSQPEGALPECQFIRLSLPGTMSTDPFVNLPHLRGKVIPADQSTVRVTPEVLATWDQRARDSGRPANWRLPDDVREASRNALLANRDASEDLWVYACGS